MTASTRPAEAGDIREISVAELHPTPEGWLLIDVRDAGEWEAGHLPGALHVSLDTVESRLCGLVPEPSAPLLFYCSHGSRSLAAARVARKLGYLDVASLAGGLSDWCRQGHDCVGAPLLNTEQRERYSRHLLLPEVGTKGQRKLLDSSVLIIGAGGLGSPAALYLAAAGVGTIGIVDSDVVDRSNLHRQVLHTTARIGTSKTQSSRRALEALDPAVNVVEHPVRLSPANAAELLGRYDVVVNGCDNFATRYLVNDTAVDAGKTVVDGVVYRFEGQVTTVVPGISTCYRCRHPVPPPAGQTTSCADVGVLGVLPGIVGTLQAAETLKVILGVGDLLTDRVLCLDALEMTFREFTARRRPDCPSCGEDPGADLTAAYDEASCAL